MTKIQYLKITQETRSILAALPGGEKLLHLPTYLCAAVYLVTLGYLAILQDSRFWRTSIVPAVCFLSVTALRPVIHRQRPYDAFNLPPIGKWEKGKGKSMPSRHTASAVAIALAVMYVFPSVFVCAAMSLLALLIAFLRVASGQHYPSDVAAAITLAAILSCIGYAI